MQSVHDSGGTPCPIPAGASGHPARRLGFANWAHEVAQQEEELGVFFDTIVVCTVTGSTHAGMIAGFADDEIDVREGWAGDEYGIPVQSTLGAIRLTGELEGIIIDPVYEGKSMAGLIDLVRAGVISRDPTVLYAHLGGQPALNAYSGVFTD